MCASITHFQENLCLNPKLIRKRYISAPSFLHVGLKVNLKDHSLGLERMTSKWTHQLEVKKNPTTSEYFRALTMLS